MRWVACVVVIGVLASPSAAQTILRDAEIEAFLRRVLAPLALAAEVPPDHVTLRLLDDPFMNAFVTDGQDLYLQAGIFAAIEDLAELEGVLAHELGHIQGGHLTRLKARSRQLRGLRYVDYALNAAALAAVWADAGGIVLGAPTTYEDFLGVPRAFPEPDPDPVFAVLSRYTRVQEHSADQAAVRILREACRDPAGYAALLQRLEPQSFYPTALYRAYFNLHPDPSERLRAVAARLQGPACAQDAAERQALEAAFARVKAKAYGLSEDPAKVRLRYPSWDQSMPARYARAHGFWRSGQAEAALEELQRLRADPHVQELRAALYFRLGQLEKARAAIDDAVAALPDAPLLRLAQADIVMAVPEPDAEDLAELAAALERAVRIEPDNPLFWDRLSRAEFRRGRDGAARLALAERLALEGAMDQARDNAQKALDALAPGTPAHRRAQDLAAHLGGP
ncbi:MAG: M48 family metalloprotease [Rhodothalassiaceae bacterium]